MKTLILPGVIAKTQAELDEMINKVKGKVERIMLDVMDGEFVPNTSLDFDFEVLLRLLNSSQEKLLTVYLA